LAKLIIFAVVLASFGVPTWLAMDQRPKRAVRKMQMIMFVFILVWAYLCLHWYPAIVPVPHGNAQQ
jgi:hypothetical protein